MSDSPPESAKRTKCGEICMHFDGYYLLICTLCGEEQLTFDSFVVHAKKHGLKCSLMSPFITTATTTSTTIICKQEYDSNVEDDLQETNVLANVRLNTGSPQTVTFELSPKFSTENDTDVKEMSEIGQRSGIGRTTQMGGVTSIAELKMEDANENDTIVLSGRRGFNCRFCNKQFNRNRDLENHENVHTGNRPHQCHICARSFSANGSLLMHIRVQHAKKAKPYRCRTCGKKFVCKVFMVVHMREKHLPDTNPRRYFSCSQCHEKFKSNAQLRYHRYAHKIEPATCDICKRKFKNRRQIYDHMRTHAGEWKKMWKERK